ncbi:DEBR0S4_05380g1_1 [Brettanomyces bruxellensis]|uniref:DEBR0S4_05380g1_1 n=1 Tax=Dekkera bruxellensis TaxID=5007 RepID=A0A7D9H5M8_DEKBR|nr:DEBR0S4_05380g1_1 [Brettanomyces bruxellensis]
MPPSTLIILPCHSIYIGDGNLPKTVLHNPKDNGPGSKEEEWILASFQKEAQDQHCLLKHLYTSINLLSNNLSDSLLVISGGYTKPETRKSESFSYLQVARERGIVDDNLEKSILLEQYARDSYENVLFSLCTFRQAAGVWPKHIKIVGFEFKRERFLNFHIRTLQFPAANVEYIGIGPEYPPAEYFGVDDATYEKNKKKYFEDTFASENKYAIKPFSKNEFGCLGSVLHDKKEKRDPFNRSEQIIAHYTIAGESAINSLLSLDNLPYNEARVLYNEECAGKFPWRI